MLEKGMAPYSSILTWRIPEIEEPGGLQSRGSQRVEHDLVIKGQQFTKGLTRKMRVKYKFPLRNPSGKQGSWQLSCGKLSCHPPGLKGMRRARDKDVDLTSEAAQQWPWEELWGT